MAGSGFEAAGDVGFDFGPEPVDGGADIGADGWDVADGEGFAVGGFAAGEEVEFDLWFGAGGADGEAAAVCEFGDEHVFARDEVAFFVEDILLTEVGHACDGGAVEEGGRGSGVAFDETADFLSAVGSGEFGAFGVFDEDAEGGEDLVEEVWDGEVAGGGVGGEFCEHDDGAVAVLVADPVGAEVAVAFFAAEDEEAAVGETGVAAFGVG